MFNAPSTSLLSRLLTLGADLFDTVSAGSRNHPAGQYCDVVRALVKATCARSPAFGALDGSDKDFLNQLGFDDFSYTDFRLVALLVFASSFFG